MYDIIITRGKLNIYKIVACVVSFIILIITCTMLGIKLANDKRESIYIQELQEQETRALAEVERKRIEEEERLKAEAEERLEKANSSLTEEAKDNILKIYSKDDGIKRVYLTFDDGPTKAVTPFILDLLKQYNIKATFFVLGQNVKHNPDLVKREFDEGHYVANHGYTHNYSKVYSSLEATLDEYNWTQEAIRDALGNQDYDCKVFRFPGGSTGGKYHSFKKECKSFLLENGIVYLDWNALNEDAAGKFTKEQLLENVIESIGTKNNAVILMHDASDKILTYEMLTDLIEYLKENDYVFCNLYDLL